MNEKLCESCENTFPICQETKKNSDVKCQLIGGSVFSYIRKYLA